MQFTSDLAQEILHAKDISLAPINKIIEISSITRTSRPEGFRLAQHSFNAIANCDGLEVLGCGEDALDESLAQMKAVSEAIERAVMKVIARKCEKKISSNGWAAHTSLEKAATAAIFELAERDSALMHWFTKTPMRQIHNDIPVPNKFIKELRQTEFPELTLLISVEFSGPVVTALLSNDKGRAISGHSSGPDLEEAIRSAVIEACRAAHHFQRFSYYDGTRALLKGKAPAETQPGMHSLMYAYHEPLPLWIRGCKIDYQAASSLWLQGTNSIVKVMEESKFSAYTTEKHVVVRAENEKLQSIFWGSTETALEQQVVNWGRLSPYTSHINLRPHMVG